MSEAMHINAKLKQIMYNISFDVVIIIVLK